MYCTNCGIDAERDWCPYCGDDMLEQEELALVESNFEPLVEQQRQSRRARRKLKAKRYE